LILNYSWQKVEHNSDMFYIFPWPYLAEHEQLSKDMIHAWTTFAKTGHPSKMGSAEWESAFTDYKQPKTKYMQLHTGQYQMIADHYVEACDNIWKPRVMGV